jgi:hypothetical protein
MRLRKKSPCFVDFITCREMKKSQILGLFHAGTPKNIDFFDFITFLAHELIGQDEWCMGRWVAWGDATRELAFIGRQTYVESNRT